MHSVFMVKGQREQDKTTENKNKKDDNNKKEKLAFGIGTVTVTDPALGVAQRSAWDMLNKFAEHLWSFFPTSGIGGDVSIAGQVQNGREQALK